jgi:hypothetical protein
MNEFAILAFIITPALVMALGWTAAYLHLRQLRRSRQMHPGE